MNREESTMTRRQFVVGAAGAAAAVAVTTVAGVAIWDRATLPPDAAGVWPSATGIDRLLLAATLAPSSHNTQPWRFAVSADGIDVLADPDRTMGAADPRLRELHVSLGCALENIAVAAAHAGTPVVIEQVPGAPARHFARVRFAPVGADGSADGRLAAAIPRRRTNRSPYDPARPVPAATLAGLGNRADSGVRVVWLTTPDERRRFTDLTEQATAAHVADAAMQRDSHRWYRMSRAEASATRDGITVSGANLPWPVSLAMGLVPPTPDSFDAGWASATRDTHCGSAPAFGLIVVPDAGDRRAWVEVGRAYQRIQLAATLQGLSTHPLSQALALRDRETAAGKPGPFTAGLEALSGRGETVLAFRIGNATREQPASLRRSPAIVAARPAVDRSS